MLADDTIANETKVNEIPELLIERPQETSNEEGWLNMDYSLVLFSDHISTRGQTYEQTIFA